MPERLSADEARRVALAAQGLGGRRPGRVDARHLRRLAERLGAIQIDSVNVLVRAHYLPAFSRLGPYPAERLDTLAYRDRALFEYWGRMASLMPVELWPLLRWRMDASADPSSRFGSWAEAHRDYVQAVYEEVARRGPLGVSQLDDPGERSGPWWGWRKGKTALEALFFAGRVSVAGRRNFERLYDVTERVIPAEVLAMRVPDQEAAVRALAHRTVRALGVATASDVIDFFWLPNKATRAALAELTDEGTLVELSVPGWRDAAYAVPDVRVPRSVDARALLSPFDSLIWNRKRTERLFGFRYRIEIYVPAAKRVYGYYVLPFLLNDRLVARVDLKADRRTSTLLVQSAFGEPDVDPATISAELAGELCSIAEWLGLEGIRVGRRGDLANPLRRAVRNRRAAAT